MCRIFISAPFMYIGLSTNMVYIIVSFYACIKARSCTYTLQSEITVQLIARAEAALCG